MRWKKNNATEISMTLPDFRKELNKKRFLAVLALVLLYFATHVPKLGSDEINPDAINWHQRSEQYVDAIKSRDFGRTYQHYHPGVTLMMVIGFPVEAFKRLNPGLIYDKSSYESFHIVAKYALVMVLLLLTLFLMFFVERLAGFRVAYVTGVLTTVEPFFLGNSRLLHMDTLLSLFLANALVCLFVGYKRKSDLYIILGAVFLGLAFWTKNVSLVAVLFSLAFTLILWIFKKLPKERAVLSLTSIALSIFVVGFAVLPALWVNPQKYFSKIYNGSRLVADEGHEEKFFGKITDNPGPYYYVFVLLFKLSPILLLLSLTSVVLLLHDFIKDLKHGLFFPLKSERLFYYYLFAFGVGYFIGIELIDKKIDRYMVPLYPILFILVSFYALRLLDKLKPLKIKMVLASVVVILFAFDLFNYFPYYFVYNSWLVGGPKAAEAVVGQKSFGVGIFEVRDFIKENYGYVKVGFVDRKPISAIYPSSMVFDARTYGPQNYDILVLDSDDEAPKKTQGKFVYDKSIKIAGLNYWNFYVKVPQ